MSKEQLFNLEGMCRAHLLGILNPDLVKYGESSSTFHFTSALAETISLDDHFQSVKALQSCDHDTNPRIRHIHEVFAVLWFY